VKNTHKEETKDHALPNNKPLLLSNVGLALHTAHSTGSVVEDLSRHTAHNIGSVVEDLSLHTEHNTGSVIEDLSFQITP